jgi:hypothetical protein
MSHFTAIKTKLADRRYLLEALRDLGHTCEEGNVAVRGYAGIRTPVEIVIPTRQRDYDIGFRKVGDAYECVADWDQLKGVRQADFLAKVAQRYAYHAAKAKLAEQGFVLASEETQKDGRIHLVLRRTT